MAVGDDALARRRAAACGLFGAADDAAIDTLVRVLRIRRFRRGETIFHQGDPGDALFVLASGSVKVVLPSDEGAEPAIVAILGPGEFFGELAILDGAPALGHDRRRRGDRDARPPPRRVPDADRRGRRACGGRSSPRSRRRSGA